MNHKIDETSSSAMKTIIMRLAQILALLMVAFVFVMSAPSISRSDSSVADSATTKSHFGVKSPVENEPTMEEWDSSIAPSLGKSLWRWLW